MVNSFRENLAVKATRVDHAIMTDAMGHARQKSGFPCQIAGRAA